MTLRVNYDLNNQMRWQDFPTFKLLIKAAKELNIDHQVIGKLGFIRFQKGKRTAFVYRSKTPLNNHVSVFLSESKYLASKILQSQGIPTQRYYLFSTPSLALKTGLRLGFPLVVKPNIGAKGKGVTANINSEKELVTAIKLAKKFHPTIALSPYFPGEDYRLLVLKNRVIGAIKREPPKIIGDGKKTIEDLIFLENKKRGGLNQNRFVPLMKIKVDKEVKRNLEKEGYQLNSVLPKNKILNLRANANWSSGGTGETLDPRSFHPSIIQSAIKATQLLTLNFAGVDFILNNPQRALKGNGIILEVNANPAIGVFHQPYQGRPQKVASMILKAILE